jgi:hypothetical protein
LRLSEAQIEAIAKATLEAMAKNKNVHKNEIKNHEKK